MPMAHSARDGGLIVDRATNSIRLQRILDAVPAQVFDAWTAPAQVSAWWDPSGQPLAGCEIDLRPGGTFSFVPKSRPDMPFEGTYLEIVPPKRLVFEAMGATGRVLLTELDGRTELTVEIQCRSADRLQQFLRMGVGEGTAQTLDNLAGYFAAKAPA